MKGASLNSRYKQYFPFIAGYILIAVLVIIIMSNILLSHFKDIKNQSFKELENISTIKSQSILNFINEEKYKLQELVNSELFNEKILPAFAGKINPRQFYEFLNELKYIKELEDILFFDPEGKTIFSFKISPDKIDSITVKNFISKNNQEVFIDIFRNSSNIVYAYQYPVYTSIKDNKALVGYIRFQYDAGNTILPRLEYFEPFSSREILFVKHEGNKLIYLTYLKKIPIKPLNLSEIIEGNSYWKNFFSTNTLSHYEGLDYSGTPVLAVIQRIPSTNWLLITKQDASEVFESYKNQSLMIGSLILMILSSCGLFLAFFFNRLKIKQTEREYQLEKQKNELEKQLDILSSHVNDAIFILNSKGEIIKTNKIVEKLYGYRPEELIGKTIDIVCKVDEMKELFERFTKIKEMGSYIYESTHRRRDGSLFDVEVNARPFELDGEFYFVGSVRDISERKKSFIELQTKLDTEKFLTEIASEMVNITVKDLDEKILTILRRIGEFVKIDRIRIFIKDSSLPFYHCKYEWCRLGVESYRESLQFLDLSNEFPFLYSVLNSGKVFKCKDVETLPSQADKEKTELKKQSIKSFLWKPIRYKGELSGFISLSTIDQIKDFSTADELIINIFSELFINSYQRILYETQILESEKRFKKLVESSSDVILIVSKDFRNMYLSPSITHVLGYTVEERLNQNPLELIHPDDLQIVKEAIEEIKNPGDKVTIQFRGKHKLGHYLYLEATLTNLYDDPLINGMVVNYHDITETRTAYLKLQESEERYRILAEESGDVLYKLNYSTMKYEYLSPVIEKLTGYTPEEIDDIGFNNIIEEISLLLNPGTTKEQIIDQRLKGETGEYLADYRIRTKNGDLKWVRDHSFPFFDSDGALIGSIGIMSDITELKKKEEEIKKRENYLNVLVDIQKSLIFLEDLKKFYNYMLPKLGKVSNVSRCYVFENSRDESGKLLMSQIAEWCAEGVTPQIDNPELQNLPYETLGNDLYSELIEKGYWAKLVKTLNEPLKSILESQDIVSILLIPIMIHDEFYGFIGFDECKIEREWTMMEIEILQSAAASIALAIESKRKKDEIIRARDEAIEANRLRSSFISILSHEIRTPLNSIMGYNEVIRERFSDQSDEELDFFFGAIKNNSLRLLNTINQLIEISRLEAGALKTKIEKLNLRIYIENICMALKIQADKKKLTLNCILPEETLLVMADDYCLNGILENLITNAIKYSEKGTIEISAKPEKEWVELKIKDEGIGISEEYLKHLFNPFSQEDVSYKRRFEGTGLGLAITKKYVDLIGGEIKIESKKGEGTTCTVKLRRAADNS